MSWGVVQRKTSIPRLVLVFRWWKTCGRKWTKNTARRVLFVFRASAEERVAAGPLQGRATLPKRERGARAFFIFFNLFSWRFAAGKFKPQVPNSFQSKVMAIWKSGHRNATPEALPARKNNVRKTIFTSVRQGCAFFVSRSVFIFFNLFSWRFATRKSKRRAPNCFLSKVMAVWKLWPQIASKIRRRFENAFNTNPARVVDFLGELFLAQNVHPNLKNCHKIYCDWQNPKLLVPVSCLVILEACLHRVER